MIDYCPEDPGRPHEWNWLAGGGSNPDLECVNCDQKAWLCDTSPPQSRDERAGPEIVCLCGSTRFAEAWKTATRELSLAGKIVLSVGVMLHAGDEPIRDDGPEKRGLDELHLRKIDLSDSVLVLNVGGYIGESTRREVGYAESIEKPIAYLEPVDILSTEGEQDDDTNSE